MSPTLRFSSDANGVICQTCTKREVDVRISVLCVVAFWMLPAVQTPTPVWRMDTTHLEEDVTGIRACLGQSDAGGERRCLAAVRDLCAGRAENEAASTMASQRACGWRAISAWEDVLTESVELLRSEIEGDVLAAFDTAHASWTSFLVDNVRAHAERFAGGTLAAGVASDERARMIAERALEVRRMLRELRQDAR